MELKWPTRPFLEMSKTAQGNVLGCKGKIVLKGWSNGTGSKGVFFLALLWEISNQPFL